MFQSSNVPEFKSSRDFRFPISHFQLTCYGFHSVIKDRKLEIGNRKFSGIFDYLLIRFQSSNVPWFQCFSVPAFRGFKFNLGFVSCDF